MDLEASARRLEAHLNACGHVCRVTEFAPLGGGRSATSVRVRLDDGGGAMNVVLHLHPEGGPLAGMTSVAQQHALLCALEATEVPAPHALWEVPAEVLGREGYITDYQPGDVPDPFSRSGREYLAGHPPNGPLAEDFLACLCAVHRVRPEPAAAALGQPLDGGAPHAVREHRRWAEVLRAAPAFADDPLLAYADAWLASTAPAPVAPRLAHCDYRVGNVVIVGERIASVLDWELAELGDPLYDLGAACSPALRTNGLACGLWEPDALVRRYEERMERDVPPVALRYFAVLATFKVVCLWINASRPFSDGADDLTALRAGFSALESRPMLAEALGLPAGTGSSSDGDGDRAIAVVQRAVRDAARTGGGELRLSAAVLRGMARPRGDLRPSFADDVEDLARDAGAPPSTGLAALARRLLDDAAFAADLHDPRHQRLRRLVAEAGNSDPAGWPPRTPAG
ncbi:MAG TPA: phosphotransferase family protein [Baekduia sp.]|uniref:phosphotransferase family protein n=1 Tax=Baekduia sp. TaxID=2600305 RepID=UPI002D78AFEA|nr:phosphotransferase family protein [Baekduia sp.]HET6509944.1 phosphotransferase family protein [Baekduia sp.]